jgi:quercetin dioxygenase-like cupin family protein
VIARRRTEDAFTTVHRSADRHTAEVPGIRSSHSFSAGADYDPQNTAFGALVGVDEHAVQPGAGFARHAHRDVAIVTWVVEGALRHEDSTGASAVLAAGQAAVQVAGRGVEHVEANASSREPLRFVQTTLLCDDLDPDYRLAPLPLRAGPALFQVHRHGPLVLEAGRLHLFVVDGGFMATREGYKPKRDALYAGDSMRVTREAVTLSGDGTVLLVLQP